MAEFENGELSDNGSEDFSHASTDSISELDPLELEQVASDSARYLSNWHELISRTNWEKGHIICQWRDKVCSVHAEVKPVSDRAWAQLVGGISAEHVGRLRRTFERFGDVYENYDRLSWTHFMVATAWDDAEMWLEGAAKSRWTIDEMRRTRWEAMGAVTRDKPDPREVIVEEISQEELDKPVTRGEGDIIQGPILEGPDWGEPSGHEKERDPIDVESIEKILASAPRDLSRSYKKLLEIIETCRDDNWQNIKKRDVLKLIAFMRQQAKSDSLAPF